MPSISYQLDRIGTYLMSFPIGQVDRIVEASAFIGKHSIVKESGAIAGLSYSWPKTQIIKSTISLALTSIAGLVGTLLYAVGRLLKQVDHYHIKGMAKSTNLGEITVGTRNLNLIWGAPRFDGTERRASRIGRVIDDIRENPPDLFFAQEVFGWTAHSLLRGLKDIYSDFYLRPGGNMVGLDAGLFIASKVPIESVKFYPFKRDPLGRRSVQFGYFLIERSNAIYAMTHFDVGPSQLHLNEYQEIIDQAQKLQKVGAPRDIYLCGDLNLSENGNNRTLVKGYPNAPATYTTYYEHLRRGCEDKVLLLDYIHRIFAPKLPTTSPAAKIEVSRLARSGDSPLSDHAWVRRKIGPANLQAKL